MAQNILAIAAISAQHSQFNEIKNNWIERAKQIEAEANLLHVNPKTLAAVCAVCSGELWFSRRLTNAINAVQTPPEDIKGTVVWKFLTHAYPDYDALLAEVGQPELHFYRSLIKPSGGHTSYFKGDACYLRQVELAVATGASLPNRLTSKSLLSSKVVYDAIADEFRVVASLLHLEPRQLQAILEIRLEGIPESLKISDLDRKTGMEYLLKINPSMLQVMDFDKQGNPL